jgi:hypothetical protein
MDMDGTSWLGRMVILQTRRSGRAWTFPGHATRTGEPADMDKARPGQARRNGEPADTDRARPKEGSAVDMERATPRETVGGGLEGIAPRETVGDGRGQDRATRSGRR